VKLLITGGTGTLGSALIRRCLKDDLFDEVICYSRDELKQFDLNNELSDKRVKFVIGDVKDRNRIFEACKGVDYIVHAAALKHVASGENHPWEVIQTNLLGTKNVVDAANENHSIMVLVSTDKAVAPANLYGCTKMAAEAIVLNGNQRVVRYGNVFGSRGSILHKFKEWTAKGHTFKITDLRMTRFVLTVDEAVTLVLDTLMMEAKTLHIPVLPSMRIVDLAKAFDPDAVIEEIGAFPGEKLHESLSDTQSSDKAKRMTVAQIKDLIHATI
jgi:UDP-N-acetylglucosamine 4,6-dehydratase